MIDTTNREALEGRDAISQRVHEISMKVMRQFGVPHNRKTQRRYDAELRKALVADAKAQGVSRGR